MSRRGEIRRERLLEAAAGLFWEQGFAATTLAEIATTADVPLGNVYYYYKTKAAIADGVAGVFERETRVMLEEVASQESDPRRRILALIRRLSETSRSRVERGCPITRAVRDFRSDAAEASRRAALSLQLLIDFIAGEFRKTGMRPSLAASRAREIVVEWQGGIALAHALGDATVLAESFRRAEQRLVVMTPA